MRKALILLFFILILVELVKADVRSCAGPMGVRPVLFFSFPTQIDKLFQEEMRAGGLTEETIKSVERIGLGSYDIHDKDYDTILTQRSLILKPITVLGILEAAARAIDRSRSRPPARPTSPWEVLRAVEFHEILHTILGGKDFTSQFLEVLGGKSAESIQILADVMSSSYVHLRSGSVITRYVNRPDMQRDMILSELLVTLVWEEALFGHAERVIDALNARLGPNDQIPKDRVLRHVRNEASYYKEDRERIFDPASFYTKELEQDRIEMTPAVQAEIPRILNPTARAPISEREMKALELEPVFNTIHWETRAREGRLTQPVLNDNAEIASRVQAQRDMDNDFRTGTYLVNRLRIWERELGNEGFWREKEDILKAYSGREFDPRDIWSILEISDSDTRVYTPQDVRDTGYFQITSLMTDILKLNRILSGLELRSERLKAILSLSQSVIDPKHPMGLQPYFMKLLTVARGERDKVLLDLAENKWEEIQQLRQLFREVTYLNALYNLGANIGGTAFANLLDPATNPPTLRFELGKNPTLNYNYKYGKEKESGKTVTPNSVIPLDGNVVSLGGGTGVTAIVLYGENEGGKSTFLRTVGGLMILASLGVRLPVAEASVTPMPVYAALNSVDSLQQGMSHHAADIASVNAVVQQVQKNRYALVLVDELATGTNQIGGNATEVAYANWFISQGVLLILSTHRPSTADDIRQQDKIRVGVVAKHLFGLGVPDPAILIEGSIQTLMRHGTPQEIIDDAREIINRRYQTNSKPK